MARSNSVKKMSFEKMMAIFGGTFVVVIVVTVIIVNASSAKTTSGSVVTQKHEPSLFAQQDLLDEQLKRDQEAEEREEQTRKSLAKQFRTVDQRLELVLNNVQALNHRVTSLESRQQETRVQIIKPERKPLKASLKQLDAKTVPLSPSTGYTVQAVVGHRAWIAAGDKESSVRVGETLPPLKSPLVVDDIDAESGIVVTSSMR